MSYIDAVKFLSNPEKQGQSGKEKFWPKTAGIKIFKSLF
ncbi:MAG: hypothetical protein ACI9P5_003474 [Saprospiraceae bacterium]|jgi:hypothetical protein|tara:strand:- start:893 stop:1009 length:117 start_codon:yes stop_codon:yes gene_type:complete